MINYISYTDYVFKYFIGFFLDKLNFYFFISCGFKQDLYPEPLK